MPLAVPTVKGDQVLTGRLTTLAISVALSCGLLASEPPSATAAAVAPAPPANSARVGAAYLARQIDANGGHLVSFGAADVSDTAYAVLGLHAAGVGAVQARHAIAFLQTQLGNLQGSDGNDDPALLGYVVMAAVASGQDPHRFGGRLPQNDLVDRLLATERTSGSDAGLFGSADPSFDGSFREGVALAALAAAGVGEHRVTNALAWLEAQQCDNGLWTSYRADVSVPCPAADPDTFAGPDTNSTSMAVQGLAAYGRFPKAHRVLTALHGIESADGGYPFLAAPGQPSDPDSTALTIQALLAEHAGPGAAMAALRSFQLGCTDPVDARGAFFFPGSRTPEHVRDGAGRARGRAAHVPARGLDTVDACAVGVVPRRRRVASDRARRNRGPLPEADGRDRERRLHRVQPRRADALRAREAVVGARRAAERGLHARGDDPLRLRVHLPYRRPAVARAAGVRVDAAVDRVLELLPRARRCDDVDLRDDRRGDLRAAARQHRRVGVRRGRDTVEDARADPAGEVGAVRARRHGRHQRRVRRCTEVAHRQGSSGAASGRA